MKSSECKRNAHRLSRRYPVLLALAILTPAAAPLAAQMQESQVLAQQIQDLKSAMATTQAQLEQSQRQLDQMKQQLNTLELRVNPGGPAATTSPAGHIADPARVRSESE